MNFTSTEFTDREPHAKCKVCGGESRFLAKATLLARHRVNYYCCSQCGFVQTEEPYWLDEAYNSAITRTDLGMLQRNSQFAATTQGLLRFCLNPNGRCLDYGGGYGIFVRMMRDSGYDFLLYDRFAPNLFAAGLAIADLSSHDNYELVTAFELFEHLVQPKQEIEQLLELTDHLLFSTVLISEPPPPLDSWWYYGLEHGQHIALYTRRTIEYMARRHHLHYYPLASNLHLLSREKMPSFTLHLVRRQRLMAALALFSRRPSLTQMDYAHMVQSLSRGSLATETQNENDV